LGDCIGAKTVGQIVAISDRAAAWLRDNPPGQPVAIEPRGCPTPGACSCVELAAPAAPEVGEVWDPIAHQAYIAFVQICKGNSDDAGTYDKDELLVCCALKRLDKLESDRAATLLQQSAPAPAVVPVAVAERPWEREGWCDEQGRCWFLSSRFFTWSLGSPPVALTRGVGRLHSLPAHAIPLPQAGEGEA
jgi:hypothetical protein